MTKNSSLKVVLSCLIIMIILLALFYCKSITDQHLSIEGPYGEKAPGGCNFWGIVTYSGYKVRHDVILDISILNADCTETLFSKRIYLGYFEHGDQKKWEFFASGIEYGADVRFLMRFE